MNTGSAEHALAERAIIEPDIAGSDAHALAAPVTPFARMLERHGLALPRTPLEILQELKEFMMEMGYRTIAEMRQAFQEGQG